jgi:hypothetical protein
VILFFISSLNYPIISNVCVAALGEMCNDIVEKISREELGST